MRVIQLLPELNEGGVERGVLELNREFSKNSINSIVISNGGKLVDEIIKNGGEHIKLDIASKNIFTAPYRIYKLKKLLKELKPDILHFRSRVPAWLLFFANKKLKIKTVSTVHGFNSVSLYSKIMTNADRIICVSGSIKEYIQKNYNTEDKKISIIPRGVDFTKFNQESLDREFIKEFKEKHNLNNYFIASVVGRITQLKDIETFIKAIALVKERIKIKALIVGSVRADKERYFKKLTDLVKNLKLENDIIFTGSQRKIAEIYSLSDVIISCSKKPESFGRSIAEALALNTPAIATNHGGVKDIIIDGENGFLFTPSNELELVKYILEISKLNKNLKPHIEKNFSLDKMVRDNINLYKGLLNC